MRRAIVWLLAMSVVTASLTSANRCQAAHQVILAGTVLAADDHGMLPTGGAIGKLLTPFSVWALTADLSAALGLWQQEWGRSDTVLPRASAALAPTTPPPRWAS